MVCIPQWGTRTLPQGYTVASPDLFLPLSHPVPSLINNGLSLPIRTQGSLGGWRKPISCHQRNGGTQNGFGPGGPPGPCLESTTSAEGGSSGLVQMPWDVFGGPGSSQPLLSPSVWCQLRQINEEEVQLQKDGRRLSVASAPFPGENNRFPSSPTHRLRLSFLGLCVQFSCKGVGGRFLFFD